jgi:hypothetical protein
MASVTGMGMERIRDGRDAPGFHSPHLLRRRVDDHRREDIERPDCFVLIWRDADFNAVAPLARVICRGRRKPISQTQK